jgi:hypothetical protein
MTKNMGGLFPLSPFSAVASRVDSGRSVASRRTRLCRGGSLDQGNPWVVVGRKGVHHRGLPVVREDDDGSDQRSSVTKV